MYARATHTITRPPVGGQVDPPTWVERYAGVLQRYEEAHNRAAAAPKDADLELARWDALGDVLAVERSMAADLILCLRKADQRSGLCLRQALTEILRDVVKGIVAEVRTDVDDLADAVAALEQQLTDGVAA